MATREQRREYKEYAAGFGSGNIIGDRPTSLEHWLNAHADRYKRGKRIRMW